MLNIKISSYFAECRCAECRCAECRCAECHYAECHYAECRCAECHYAECRCGTKSLQFGLKEKLIIFFPRASTINLFTTVMDSLLY